MGSFSLAHWLLVLAIVLQVACRTPRAILPEVCARFAPACGTTNPRATVRRWSERTRLIAGRAAAQALGRCRTI